jgi:hypothetical protein
MNRSKILLTGAAGAVGTVLLPALTAKYDVIALDRRRTQHTPYRRTSITRLGPLVRASEMSTSSFTLPPTPGSKPRGARPPGRTSTGLTRSWRRRGSAACDG